MILIDLNPDINPHGNSQLNQDNPGLPHDVLVHEKVHALQLQQELINGNLTVTFNSHTYRGTALDIWDNNVTQLIRDARRSTTFDPNNPTQYATDVNKNIQLIFLELY